MPKSPSRSNSPLFVKVPALARVDFKIPFVSTSTLPVIAALLSKVPAKTLTACETALENVTVPVELTLVCPSPVTSLFNVPAVNSKVPALLTPSVAVKLSEMLNFPSDNILTFF